MLLAEFDFLLDLLVVGVVPFRLDAGAGVEVQDRFDKDAEAIVDALVVAGAQVPAENAEGGPLRRAVVGSKAEDAVISLDVALVAADLEGLVLQAEFHINLGLATPRMEFRVDETEAEVEAPGLTHRCIGVIVNLVREADAEAEVADNLYRTIRLAGSGCRLVVAEERKGEVETALREAFAGADDGIGAGLDGGGVVVVGVLLGAEDFDLLALGRGNDRHLGRIVDRQGILGGENGGGSEGCDEEKESVLFHGCIFLFFCCENGFEIVEGRRAGHVDEGGRGPVALVADVLVPGWFRHKG